MKIWSHMFDRRPTPVQSVRVATHQENALYFNNDGKLANKKVTKVKTHQDPVKKAFKDSMALMAGCGTWHEKKHIIDYPIRAELYHFYEYPKGLPPKVKQRMEDLEIYTFPKTSRPDVTDNLNKGVFDSLKEILLDDSYVYELNAKKFWAPKDQIVLTFYKPYVEEFLLPWCHGKKVTDNNYYIGMKDGYKTKN